MPDILAGLDDDQRAAAEVLHGPLVIHAGAGSGKTRTITHRIAHGVSTGAFDPTATLAVTFTSRAAGELRTLLVTGPAGAGKTWMVAAALRDLPGLHLWTSCTEAATDLRVLDAWFLRLGRSVPQVDSLDAYADAVARLLRSGDVSAVVVEDVHHAGPDLLAVLAALAGQIGRAHV